MRANKPLLGFGPAGWALLAVAVVLVVALITGYDLRHQIFRAIAYLFGPDVLKPLIYYVLYPHWLNIVAVNRPPEMFFGLGGMCAVLIGFQIHPRRSPAWVGLAVVALALSLPILHPLAGLWISGRGFYPVGVILPGAHYPGELAVFIAAHATVVGVLWTVTRSRHIAIGVGAVFLLAIVAEWGPLNPLLNARNEALLWVSQSTAWAWNPLLLLVMLSWAIPARFAARRASEALCPTCSYDLRGITVEVCPECGQVVASGDERTPPAPCARLRRA